MRRKSGGDRLESEQDGLDGSCLGRIALAGFFSGDADVRMSWAVAYVVPLMVVTGMSWSVAMSNVACVDAEVVNVLTGYDRHVRRKQAL